MKELLSQVAEFHFAFDLPIRRKPGIPPYERQQLRLELIREESAELEEAVAAADIVAISKELADLAYVVAGMALEFGIPLDKILAEVHRSNMTKLGPDSKPIKREDGKVLKGPGYRPPQVANVLFEEDYNVG